MTTGDASAPAPGDARALPRVTRLRLTDFRNYTAADLAVAADAVVLTGPNGAGKTNILEALSFLSPGRGLRRARMGDVARRQGDRAAPAWAVAATLETATGPLEIGTGIDPAAPERRALRIDGIPQRGQTVLADHLSIAWLTPQMDRLFVEGASSRRRFLDRLAFGFDPGHAKRLSTYEHAQSERARVLAASRTGKRADPAWLDGIEAGMAESAVAVAAARVDFVTQLQGAIDRAVGPFPAADLALDGVLEAALAGGETALAVEDTFRATLASARRIDAEAGTTTQGPHRTDLAVRHRAKNMSAQHCSTGEQKAVLVAIVLANARLVRDAVGRPPILLLDEIAAHLDSERREALYGTLAELGGQAWMTGTDDALFAPLSGIAQFVSVPGLLDPSNAS